MSDMIVLEVFIDTPKGSWVEEIELPADATPSEIEANAEDVFLNVCSYSYQTKEADR